MCGIVGIINLNKEETYLADDLHRMTCKIKHRGPDDEGYTLFSNEGTSLFYGDDTPLFDHGSNPGNEHPQHHIRSGDRVKAYMAFGHRRLSIIDLTFMGHQPMCYMNRYWIVYNGEIYNYIEIKKELEQQGYAFTSHSDTEVIMAAYDCWGVKCLEKFNGMWAFVIYDLNTNIIFMARDRFGEKPLYYYKNNEKLLFASEIKAILAHPEVISGPNIDYCREYVKEGPKEYIKETAFENIYRFAHASYVELSLNDLRQYGIKEKGYWACSTNLSNEKFDEKQATVYADKYCDLLSDSVKLRLRADVKIGAALSGGLDSSSIVYMINQHLSSQGKTEKLETFSSIYKSSEAIKNCDESAYIDDLSLFLNVKSKQIEPQVSEIIAEHKKMIYAMENPAVGPNMGGWYTFKLIGDSDVTINLDGQGADEQLAGYFSYLWRYFANLPLSEVTKEFMAFSRVPGVKKRKILVSIAFNILERIMPSKVLKYLTDRIGVKYNMSLLTPVNDILYESTMTGLVNLLHYGDSQSMAHSIESRLPFLDHRLVEFLASVPASYKIHNGWTKYLARLAMDKKLPDNITWRKDKMGWPDPSDYWFKGPLKEWLCKEIESSPFLKEMDLGRDIRRRIESNEPVINLVRLLNLSVWYKVYFSNKSKA